MEREEYFISNDEAYYLFYQMMHNALETDSVIEGLKKSLYLLKLYLNSGDVVLHRKEKDGTYNHCGNQALTNDTIGSIECIVNKTSKLVESKDNYFIDLNLSEEFKNIMLLYIKSYTNEYILSVNNVDVEKSLNDNFQNRLTETMKILLKRADMYEKNTTAINIDALTGLNNRTSYESTIQSLDASNEKLVYGIFDLFRLKYVNDNYSHSLGDKYIIAVANILNNYWPKYFSNTQTNNQQDKNKTGHHLYRVGGDEFVLLTTRDRLELVEVKARLAAEEASIINLGTGEDLQLGLNFGVVQHNPEDTIKESYIKADIIMQEDKKKMYLKYGLDRRR